MSKTPRKGLKITLISIIGALVLAGGVFAYLFFFHGLPFGKIMENVTVAGVDVGGMSKEDAVAAVTAAVGDSYTTTTMEVTLGDDTISLSPALTGAVFDAEKAVETAYNYGRSGSYSNRKAEQKQAAESGIQTDLSESLTLQEDAIRQELEKLGDKYSTPLVQTTYEVKGERPALEELPAPDGEGDPLPPAPEENQTLLIKKGTASYTFDLNSIYEQILTAYGANRFDVLAEYTVTEPEPLDLEKLHQEVCVQPVDAVMDEKTFEISPHVYGYAFDLEEATKRFESTAPGGELELPFAVVLPKATSYELEALLFRDVLGSYTAYSASEWGRDINLRKSCEAINGYIIYPGEIFDYNPTLGERTAEAGWGMAAGYVGNKTVTEYGGGICQASSCLYLSALIADLEIVERTNHGFISAYMPYGMDATVSWGGPELKIRNNTDYPIRIEAYGGNGMVSVKLLGTDTKDYYVKMDYEILGVYPYETVYKEMKPDNKEGYKDGQVLVTPYTGYTVKTYRCKYDKATDKLISSALEATNYYSKRDKEVVKIIQPKPVEPEDPKPPVDDTGTGGEGTGGTGGEGTGGTGEGTGGTGEGTGGTGEGTGGTGEGTGGITPDE